jgi:uncharacterized protein YbjT (DUF2867 family)
VVTPPAQNESGPPPVLVLGATGGQGGAVAEALTRAGQTVRAFVRDPGSAGARRLSAAGAQLAAGEFTDQAALTAAMRGAAAGFALTTPFESGPDAEVLQGQAIIRAAAETQLPHLVFSSVAGATAGTGVPHFESKAVVERALAASGIPHTVVAPTYFYDNALGGDRDLLAATLELPLSAGHRLQQLDRPDLGSFVEFVLRDPHPFAGRRIELASDAPTPAQMCQALADALGRPIQYRQTPMTAVRSHSADMAAMWDFLRGRGYQADIGALQLNYPAVRWTSFAAWAKRTFGPDGRAVAGRATTGDG